MVTLTTIAADQKVEADNTAKISAIARDIPRHLAISQTLLKVEQIAKSAATKARIVNQLEVKK
jgi:hypothetical protein